MTVSSLGERAVLARIQATLRKIGRPASNLVVGIGDDAAIITPDRQRVTVLTTDMQVEGVHFERRFSSPGDIGARALAVNLSDIAAMGAAPRWALVSLALPGACEVEDVEALMLALATLGATHGVTVIGGNLTSSPGPLVVDVTLVGDVHPRRVLRRDGGRPGDAVYVSGTLGAAAAGLAMLAAGVTGDVPRGDAACIARYRRPNARVRLGQAVAQARAARAAMDLSDGLADAARQVADASGCGIEIDADLLPIDAAARAWWDAAGIDAVGAALGSGDDYELLFAVAPGAGRRLQHARSRVATPLLTRVGVLTKAKGEHVMIRGGIREPLPQGFGHWDG